MRGRDKVERGTASDKQVDSVIRGEETDPRNTICILDRAGALVSCIMSRYRARVPTGNVTLNPF
jgi:hypothetical protein